MKEFKIGWGSWGHFQNYTTVYLWHEILHLIMELEDVSHAVNQMATDNELRIRLNKTSYPPLEGHDWLKPIMKKILPKWGDYLQSDMNLLEFVEFMKNDK